MPGVFNLPSPFGPEYRADAIKNNVTRVSFVNSNPTPILIATGPCRVRGYVHGAGVGANSRLAFKEGGVERFYVGMPVELIAVAADGFNASYTTNTAEVGTDGHQFYIDIVLPAGWTFEGYDHLNLGGTVRGLVLVEAL